MKTTKKTKPKTTRELTDELAALRAEFVIWRDQVQRVQRQEGENTARMVAIEKGQITEAGKVKQLESTVSGMARFRDDVIARGEIVGAQLNRLDAHDNELAALRGETATLHDSITQVSANQGSMLLMHSHRLAELERPKPSFWRRLWAGPTA